MKFAKELNSVSNRYHTSQIFDDFLQMAVCAYSLGRSEEIYHKIVKKYNESELNGFARALGALIAQYEETNATEWNDYLGNYFEEFGQPNAKTGQFFTPVTLCNLIAQMTDDRPHGTVNDPSCGSSRNLIAHAWLKPNNRFDYFYVGQDLDRRCCLMSVINFVMFGMKGVVIHMNTISLEIYGGWRIYLPETCLGVKPMSIDECKGFVFEVKEEKPQPEIIAPKPIFEQLKLF